MTAQQAQDVQASENNQLQADKASVEQQLHAAQAKVTGLQGQRQRYQDWLGQKQRNDEAAAQQAALGAAKPGKAGQPVNQALSAPAGASIEAVVARALSKLGAPYAWGGGNGNGPTRGTSDGGRYSAIASPDPPIAVGKSRSLGRPSLMGKMVSS